MFNIIIVQIHSLTVKSCVSLVGLVMLGVFIFNNYISLKEAITFDAFDWITCPSLEGVSDPSSMFESGVVALLLDNCEFGLWDPWIHTKLHILCRTFNQIILQTSPLIINVMKLKMNVVLAYILKGYNTCYFCFSYVLCMTFCLYRVCHTWLCMA